MADEGDSAIEPAPPPPMPSVQLPLTTTVEHPGTLLMMMQVMINPNKELSASHYLTLLRI
jgi:hypothetical protein